MNRFQIHTNEDGETVLQKRLTIPGAGVAWETIATRKDFEEIGHLTINACVDDLKEKYQK